MIKNVSKWIMLLAGFAFLLSSCSATRRTPSKSPTTTKGNRPDRKNALRSDIVDFALQYKGASYKYGGNGPKSFDCSGLTCEVYKKFNVVIPRTSSTQGTQGKKIPQTQAKPGDLAFFRKGSSGAKINHVALIISNGREGLMVIHSTSSRGVIVENISKSTYWKPRLLYIRDVIGN